MKLTTEIGTITLAGGEKVGVFDFYVRATYSLLIAGKPDKELNESILSYSARDAQDWWNEEREALVLRPRDEQMENQLPALRMMALLDCSTPLNPDYHGSNLRVVWFAETLPSDFREFFKKHLENLDWKANARDYYT